MPSKCKKKSRKPKSLKSPEASGIDKLFEDITKENENRFQIEDINRAGLPSPRIPVTGPSQASEQHKPGEADSPIETSLRKRIRALTLGSAKKPPELNSNSRELKASPPQSSQILSSSFRDSSTTEDSNSPERSPLSVSTIIQHSKGKKRGDSVTSPSSAWKYLRSPTDYTMIDFDYCEAQAAMNSDKVDAGAPDIKRSSIKELLAYLRRETGTEIRAIDVHDPKVARRPNEARPWDHKNLWCVDCRKACPLCNASCCVKEEATKKAVDESLDQKERDDAKRLVDIIDKIGIYAKDVGTFSQCTPPDGCGRYVCPECCGVCPSEICRDIQCKECKPNPWASCEWHD
ncbi:uncharacterized protein DSM5745_07788 [Aspergillus mulundensis]|uniref:Uncharacterized protein n=1 Tax=Aspergillus mulundensis TaxID=1810919 RepID=A0A3D8RF78_9EURO|nr:hypothetical protein DSM5745_07788 [Aspergillus mulundensis]RDW72616.1 hypothetical protein DSM5745_07788 [Aspergillus mulundensis]